MGLKIQIVSDLHLEFRRSVKKFNYITPEAPILIMAGDICCLAEDEDFEAYKNLIAYLLPKFDIIVHVPGNHEYYCYCGGNHSMKDCDTKISELFETVNCGSDTIEREEKVSLARLYYLNNSHIDIKYRGKKYRIVGSPLWYKIPKTDKHIEIAETYVSDYRYIYVNGKKLTTSHVNKLHKRCIKYISGQIAECKKKGIMTIVVTHHKPHTYEPVFRNKTGKIKSTDAVGEDKKKEIYKITEDMNDGIEIPFAYESDQTKYFGDNLLLWAYGHTHLRDDNTISGTRVYSMPRGYPHQKTNFISEVVSI